MMRLAHNISSVVAASIGGGKLRETPGVFELLPEERRYFDPDYVGNEDMDALSEAALDDADAGVRLHQQLVSSFGGQNGDDNN